MGARRHRRSSSPRPLRWVCAVALALSVAGCPREIGDADGGADASIPYDPVLGNSFRGPLSIDDQRVRDLDPSALPAGDDPCREPVLVRVYRVIDGDTFEVRGEDTVLDVRVRFIGIDTPELGRDGEPDECYAREADAFTRQLDGHLLWLTFDNDCFDRFDRLLAYLHIGGGQGDFFQRQLLRRGFAVPVTIGNNRQFEGLFSNDEVVAEAEGQGLFSVCR